MRRLADDEAGLVRVQQLKSRDFHAEFAGILMALVALALAWAGRTAATLLGTRAPKRKSHGYFAKSWFRIGFDRIRNLLRTDPRAAVAAWFRLSPKPLKRRRVV